MVIILGIVFYIVFYLVCCAAVFYYIKVDPKRPSNKVRRRNPSAFNANVRFESWDKRVIAMQLEYFDRIQKEKDKKLRDFLNKFDY